MREASILKTSLAVIIVFLLAPLLAWSQATSSVSIPVSLMIFQQLSNDTVRVDLLKEAKKMNPALAQALEIQMVRVSAKAGVGGAQLFLRVGNDYVSSVVVDTDPALLASMDPRSYSRYELKNFNRGAVQQANLVIQSAANAKIGAIEVVLGAAQEPVVMGRYNTQNAQRDPRLAQIDTQNLRPSSGTVDEIYQRYYGDAEPVAGPATTGRNLFDDPANDQGRIVLRPPPRPAAPQPVCLRTWNGGNICVGDLVKNRYGFVGRILSMNTSTRMIRIKFDFSDQVLERSVDTVQK